MAMYCLGLLTIALRMIALFLQVFVRCGSHKRYALNFLLYCCSALVGTVRMLDSRLSHTSGDTLVALSLQRIISSQM